jgi:SAM-dependent methyltransferase
MNNTNKKQIESQIDFFNRNALHKHDKYFLPTNAFDWYAIKPVLRAMKFIYSSAQDYVLLDYGCGIGDSIEIFKISNGQFPNRLVGLDISSNAISEISTRYDYDFFHIDVETGLQELGLNVDAAYMIHVLHHAVNHKKIIDDLCNSIKPDGKLVIVDIGSKNPFQEIGRKIFSLLPKKIKNKFQDDLLIDGEIPEKLPVDIKKIQNYLTEKGFITELTYSSSFIFIFGWLFKILNIKFDKDSPTINFFFKIDDWFSNKVFKEYSVLYLIEAKRA